MYYYGSDRPCFFRTVTGKALCRTKKNLMHAERYFDQSCSNVSYSQINGNLYKICFLLHNV